MDQQKAKENQHKNKLASYRRKRCLSQRHMAQILGHKSHAPLWSYEQGVVIPNLESALKLEIVLRTPVAFLFPSLYEALRSEIRAKEEKMAGSGQQDLFNYSPKRL